MTVFVAFTCPCGAEVEGHVEGGVPNLMAETIHDSEECNITSLVCDACSKDFDVNVITSMAGTRVRVPGAIDVSWDVSNDPEEQEIIWEIRYTEQLDRFRKTATDIIALSRADYPKAASYTMHCMLYAQVVAAVESYLSGIFISRVVNSEKLIKALVESDPELAKRQLSLKDIFTKIEGLKLEVGKYLKELIFHNLNKVKPMFKAVLGYEMQDIAWLFRAVLIRHDCVHRNGLTTDGEAHVLDVSVIEELVRKSTALVADIDRFVSEVFPIDPTGAVAPDQGTINALWI